MGELDSSGGLVLVTLLALAVTLVAVGVWGWRAGRPRLAAATGAFIALGGLAAAAPRVADQVDQLVTGAQAGARTQEGAARLLLEATGDRHLRQLEAARAITDGAPERLVQGFVSLAEAAVVDGAADFDAAPPKAGGVVYVAVSFSMPPADLRRLAREAQTAGALVVIQGLVRGSFKETAVAARQVFDESSLGGVAIDPNIFRAFDIRAAPTFIAADSPVQPCASGLDCRPVAPAHDRVAGNISLSEALRILGEGDQAASVARAAAARLAP